MRIKLMMTLAKQKHAQNNGINLIARGRHASCLPAGLRRCFQVIPAIRTMDQKKLGCLAMINEHPEFKVRIASSKDVPEIVELIKSSSRLLAKDYYSNQQIEAALKSPWGVDTQLIVDGTYFLAESKSRIIGCGGWSRRV